MGYRIKTVSERTGVPRNTLLAWERRYDLVSPDRQGNGYREYTDEDIERIQTIKGLVDQGYKVSEAIRLVHAARAPAPADGPEAVPPAPAGPSDLLSATRAQVLEALVAFDRTRARRLIDRVALVSFETQIEHLWMPMLRELGEGWVAGRTTIAEEHFASEFIREQLIAMLLNLDYGPSDGAAVVCSGFPGDRHEGGLLAVAVRLAMRGRRVVWLGADVPAAQVVQVAKARSATMVCCSAMLPRPKEELQAYAAELVAGLPGVEVVIGGAAVPHAGPPPMTGVRWVGMD
jgi:DNA-binding transcriptional MerR regulator